MNQGTPHNTASSRAMTRASRHFVGGNEAAGLVAGADVFRERVRDVACQRGVERGAVLRADLGEERRHGFRLAIGGGTGLC
ncbi:hypothetical protein QF025_001597 [Paraburkholderia graminis]|uniref:Uncharacterized protein n=1 Tax=Paraburkholderia graminis TaxID=60548 RepID=A0ABD5CCE2_9BURK|nr:hypothetical protein [Paraburkholderia graminis]